MPSQLANFLPYLLNQAAEGVSREFQPHYRDTYGMLRTEWRVLFHLGCHGDMTAKEICTQAAIHKTKVSRAVLALDKKRMIRRHTVQTDRRSETLSLTRRGHAAFADLSNAASHYENTIEKDLGQNQLKTLKNLLITLIEKQNQNSNTKNHKQ